MKTRNGFVSNSSSSSYIICGWEFDIANIDIKSPNVFNSPCLQRIIDDLELNNEFNLSNVKEDDYQVVYKLVDFLREKFKDDRFVIVPTNDLYSIIFGMGVLGDEGGDTLSDNNMKMILNSKKELKKLFPKLSEPKFRYGEAEQY